MVQLYRQLDISGSGYAAVCGAQALMAWLVVRNGLHAWLCWLNLAIFLTMWA
jgi:hypothetical protein